MERTARDGDWIGVFGAQVTLLLPADARSRAARAWPLVDADADHVEVLDDLLADGLAQLCDFVLVEQVGDRTRVVARGDAEVTAHSAEGRVRVRASDLTWQEDVFVGLVALQVALPGTAVIDTGHFDVRPGICRVGGVTWGEVPDERPAVREDQSVHDDDGPPTVAPVVGPVSPPLPVDSAPAAPPPESPPVVPSSAVPDSPALPPLPPVPPVPPAPRSVPEPPETAPLSSTPLTPSWQEEPTGVLPTVEEEEMGGLAALGFGIDDPEEDDGAPGAGPWTVATLLFSHGETVAVDGPVLVGRAPSPGPGSPGAHLVAVPSPQQEVSSTHLEIRPGDGLDLGTAVVIDLGSTNGTVVVHPGLPARDLRPGEPHALLPGAVVDLGDGVTIEVRRP